MKRIAIVGAGVLGCHIAHYVNSEKGMSLAGYFDDYQSPGSKLFSGAVLGGTNEIEAKYAEGVFDEALLAIGYKHFNFRMELFERLRGRIPFARLIHSSSYIDSSCQVGDGVVILPGCFLDMNVTVRDNVFLNIGCVIAHDSTIDSHSFLAPGVKTAGFVLVGKCCFLGVGTTVSSRINLCDFSSTGAGAVLIQDAKLPNCYVGVPAQILEKETGNR